MSYRFWSLAVVATIAAALFVVSNAQKEAPTSPTPKEVTPRKIESTSILLRVRRVTYEDAYVAVPATDAIMKKDGTGYSVDFDALVANAIEISKDQRVEWKVESSSTQPHPIQQPLPPDRKLFDAIVDLRSQK